MKRKKDRCYTPDIIYIMCSQVLRGIIWAIGDVVESISLGKVDILLRLDLDVIKSSYLLLSIERRTIFYNREHCT